MPYLCLNPLATKENLLMIGSARHQHVERVVVCFPESIQLLECYQIQIHHRAPSLYPWEPHPGPSLCPRERHPDASLDPREHHPVPVRAGAGAGPREHKWLARTITHPNPKANGGGGDNNERESRRGELPSGGAIDRRRIEIRPGPPPPLLISRRQQARRPQVALPPRTEMTPLCGCSKKLGKG